MLVMFWSPILKIGINKYVPMTDREIKLKNAKHSSKATEPVKSRTIPIRHEEIRQVISLVDALSVNSCFEKFL